MKFNLIQGGTCNFSQAVEAFLKSVTEVINIQYTTVSSGGNITHSAFIIYK